MNLSIQRFFTRFIAVLLSLLLAFPIVWVAPVQANSDLFEGKGTKEKPYLISSAEQLLLLGQVYSDYPNKSFKQTANIDLSPYADIEDGKGWIPIGWEVNNGTPFQSIYDGGGYTITGLAINRPEDSNIGLFGTIGEFGVVNNVHISSGTINGKHTVGAIAAINYGSIVNSGSNVEINGGSYLGGLVGENYGVISNGTVIATVSGSGGTIGGLAATNYGLVIDSHVTGNNSVTCVTYGNDCDIVAQSSPSGGLVGKNYNGRISESSSSASVKGTYSVGGLAGENNGEIFRSHASGNVISSDWRTGGLVGINEGLIRHSYANGNVNAPGRFTGGLVGYNFAGEIAWSHATGNVIGKQDTGGLVGSNEALIHYSYATGNVTGTNNVGGLVGTNLDTVIRSYATGDVQGSGNTIGGLIGNHVGTLKDVYVTGNIRDGDLIGGLVGSHGGLTQRAYTSTQVPEDKGALVGWFSEGTFESVYWNLTSSGASNLWQHMFATPPEDVHGLNAEEMTNPDSFVGWDFITTWVIKDGHSGPTLRMDLGWLLELITIANADLQYIEIGNQPGQFPEDAVSLLQTEIMSAQELANDTMATEAELRLAADELDKALNHLWSSIIRNEISLVIAEEIEVNQMIELTFDQEITEDSVEINLNRFHISDPNIAVTNMYVNDETRTILLEFEDTLSSDQVNITMLKNAIYINGYPNEFPSTVRLITGESRSQLQTELFAEGDGYPITIQNVIRYLQKSNADINGDGIINRHDIQYLLKFIEPIIS